MTDEGFLREATAAYVFAQIPLDLPVVFFQFHFILYSFGIFIYATCVADSGLQVHIFFFMFSTPFMLFSELRLGKMAPQQ